MNEESRLYREVLGNQLELLRGRLARPDAGHWRQMGKLAQDFTVWLERARPWMGCASRLIALRVEQIVGEMIPEHPSEKVLKKFSDLLEEAHRHLSNPGQAIQVIDLERDSASMRLNHESVEDLSCSFAPWEGLSLPSLSVEIPDLLRPDGNPPAPFRYLIPN